MVEEHKYHFRDTQHLRAKQAEAKVEEGDEGDDVPD